MANDEREEEAAFLADLEARTGRGLAEWMAAITAQAFKDKNEIIDWLRSQGIPFARASWLERIHNNAGKPIYADHSTKPERTKASTGRAIASPAPPDAGSGPQQDIGDAAALAKVIAAAKGYRPLYHLLEGELRKAIPGLAVSARAGLISLAAPAEFAVVVPSATELRLGLDLGDRVFDVQVQKAKLRGARPAITHMIVLTDARQINGDLMQLAGAANSRVNG
jgi:hypothetical protein